MTVLISPLALVQEHEDVRCDPWRVLVACVLCNRTPASRALPVALELFGRWGSAVLMAGADERAVASILRPLGMQRARAGRLVRMSLQYVNNLHTRAGNSVADLEGVGRYGADAWALFVEGRVHDVHPTDRELRRWLDWRLLCGER